MVHANTSTFPSFSNSDANEAALSITPFSVLIEVSNLKISPALKQLFLKTAILEIDSRLIISGM
jgi:hypothetical protein